MTLANPSFLLAGFISALGASADGAIGRPSPDPVKIFSRAVLRAGKLADDSSAIYLFDKRTKIDTLDAKGKTTKRKVKLFAVTMTGGVPTERLIGLEGKELSAKEIAKEEEKSSRWRRRFVKTEGGSKRQSFVPADMARKFDFVFEGTEAIEGRPVHRISFKPKSPPPAAKGFSDRIVNQLLGTLWIDVGEFEIVRIDVKLGERVKLWAGILGALDEFEFKLNRKRDASGVWYNELADISLNARGLFKRLRMRIVEQSSNFRKAPEIIRSAE